MTTVAIIQEPPVFLDREKTIEKAAHCVQLAANQGAELVVFSETFIPGYPAWIWRLRPGGDWGLLEQLHGRLLANAVQLESEQLQPLVRCALFAQGIEIYIAPTYDSGDKWIQSLQHIAREGGCWVLGAGNVLRVSDLPADFPELDRLYPDSAEWINQGDSLVINPSGDIVAGPLRQETGLVLADIDLEQGSSAKRSRDIVGHYSRPDIFSLQVNTRAQRPVEFLS